MTGMKIIIIVDMKSHTTMITLKGKEDSRLGYSYHTCICVRNLVWKM